jgi:hypothetical protein
VTDSPNARKITLTVWTFVKKTSRTFADRKRQVVAALFVVDPKIAARLTPFVAMRQDSASAGAKLGEEMRQFMTKGEINLCRSVLAKSRI